MAEYFKILEKRNNFDASHIADTVSEIVNRVKYEGDKAILHYTKKFDKIFIDDYCLKVSENEFEKAYTKVDEKLLSTIKKACGNIKEYHEKQKNQSWFCSRQDGVILGQKYTPLKSVGVYVPGGTAPLISSVLMNVLPAKAAGVEKIIMATPPQRDGSINPAMLVAAREAGAAQIYKMGGAQAIAAFAYGTDSVPRVDKITGPGNIYVAAAKRLVYGNVDIDMFAGPSEICVIADGNANASYIAADMLSQAEHDVIAASVLITVSKELAEKVDIELEEQFNKLKRKEIIKKSLDNYGAIILVNSIKEAVELSDRIAPEHLEILVDEPFKLLGEVGNAGAVFLGPYSPEPIGDYFAGPNHVLPTGGTARFFSPLDITQFVKKSSVIYYTKDALLKDVRDVERFALAESLDAHARAVTIRAEGEG